MQLLTAWVTIISAMRSTGAEAARALSEVEADGWSQKAPDSIADFRKPKVFAKDDFADDEGLRGVAIVPEPYAQSYPEVHAKRVIAASARAKYVVPPVEKGSPVSFIQSHSFHEDPTTPEAGGNQIQESHGNNLPQIQARREGGPEELNIERIAEDDAYEGNRTARMEAMEKAWDKTMRRIKDEDVGRDMMGGLPEGAHCCQIKKATLKDVVTKKKLIFNDADEDFKNAHTICHRGPGVQCEAAIKLPVMVNLVWVQFDEWGNPEVGSVEHQGGGLDGFSADIDEITEAEGGAETCHDEGITVHCNSIDLWDHFVTTFNENAADKEDQPAPEFEVHPKHEAPLIAISTLPIDGYEDFRLTGGLFERKFRTAISFAETMDKEVDHTPSAEEIADVAYLKKHAEEMSTGN
eukprot:gnl/MRDRNA2_/MRDRNA2_44708_c0_seq1.p1 gnl/MRDRNA2_/MRDRNA2_44708_c0~~gnl/MRDRNA2_/MRDRNA2_44708_c0_seq1.p1  ORF type:complete len:440 (+),score=114.53 gnl/MRDRNA2_/MRDRNA2_44708_c0_seq1:97-1320(+)